MQIGIRREDKNRWEARTPLTPDHVERLIKEHGVSFVIQPSRIRAFSDASYRRVGAVVSEDLSGCDMILAVKEIPESFFKAGKTYVFFSHTMKGQPANIPMLQTLLDAGSNLIDYEKITDHADKRLIFFGRHAGLVGMINTLWALGRRFKHEGHITPFLSIRQAVNYKDLKEAKQAVLSAGAQIARGGLSEKLGPLVFGFSGYGNVSRGAQEIFDLLPFERVAPDRLPKKVGSCEMMPSVLYKAVFREEDMFEPVDPDRVFVLKEYFEHPEKYRSKFERHLPYLSVLVNAIYWEARYPRLVTIDYLRKSYSKSEPRLKVIGDITCDEGGSVQCNTHSTDSGDPLYVYDPDTGRTTPGVEGKGPVILATDNLPCELGRESSDAFSSVLFKFIPEMAETNFSKPFDRGGFPDEIQRAVVVWHGKLTPRFEYLQGHIDRVLGRGAGK